MIIFSNIPDTMNNYKHDVIIFTWRPRSAIRKPRECSSKQEKPAFEKL